MAKHSTQPLPYCTLCGRLKEGEKEISCDAFPNGIPRLLFPNGCIPLTGPTGMPWFIPKPGHEVIAARWKGLSLLVNSGLPLKTNLL
jgi:hypothetical protein